jgi:cell division protein FtsB
MDVAKFISRIAFLAAIGLVLAIAWVKIRPKLEQNQHLQEQIEALAAENRALEARIEELKRNQELLETDPRFVERVAREELGYVRPGETVFRFMPDDAE